MWNIQWNQASKEIGLFHNSNKFLLADLSVAVTVGLIDHFLELVVSHGLTELPGDSL
jgi:hypothetical protein